MKDLQPTSPVVQPTPPPVPPKTVSLSNNVPVPDQLQCVQCKMFKAPKDHWWCRSCHKTLCSCNLLQGHTEHRTTPWRPDELVRSLVDSIEARCSARIHRASEEEAAIKEYMREIEGYFLNKLHRQLDERNEEDRSLVTVVCTASNVTSADRKRWPPATHSPTVTVNSSTSSSVHPTLVGFDLLTDDSVARLVQEIGRLLPPDGARTLTVNKFPRMTIPTSNQSSPLLGADRRSFIVTKTESATDLDQNGRSPASTNGGGASRFYNFAAVLPDIEPLEFAQLLEQQRDFLPRMRSTSQSGPPGQQARSTTPFLEHVSSRAQSPAPGANGVTLSVYGTLDVDATDDSISSAPDTEKGTLSSRSIVVTQAQTHYHERSTLRNGLQPLVPPSEEASSVQLMISEDTQTSSSSWLTSATQTETIGNGDIQATSTPKGSPEEPRNTFAEAVQASGDTSVDSTKSNGANGRSISITAFHFGDDYLTRPIDVRPLPNDRLAVSDSCGGVYVTNAKGDVIHQIWLDGYSASSLCYLTTNRPSDEDRHPPLLLVSVLRKRNRSINFYDARDFTLLDTVDCPNEPQIDLGRSRWLAADDRGAVYLVSGDGKVSALWKYYPATKGWLLLKQTTRTRYQYLDIVHTMTDPASVTVLTCDGVRGSLLLITVSRNTSNGGHNKILAEQDVSQTYGLDRWIRSPASAVVDYQGNMIILDYSTGKLWLLRAPNSAGSRQNGNDNSDRRLKLLTEVGSQQGIGLSVTAPWDGGYRPHGEHWCYLACFNKKRVHAVKYLTD